MNRSKGLVRASTLIVVSLVLSLAIPFFPSLATSSNDITLGTTTNFSLVSGGVIVLDASARFAGNTPIQTALVAAVNLDTTTVARYTAAGVTNFIQNTDTATSALNDAIALRTQLESLTAVSRPAVIGNETVTAGNYYAVGGAAFDLTTPLVLDGGGDYNSIFVFRTPAAFTVTAGLNIRAINGAQPSHIFWVMTGAITIGANVTIPGTFISPAAITLGDHVVVNGSLLGTTAAAITLGANSVINHSTRTSLSSWSNVTKKYGDAAFAATPPTVAGSIPGAFSYSSETSTIVSVSGSTLNVVGVGSTRITTTFTPSNGFLYYSETATMVITVGIGSQVITWAPTTSILTTATPLTPSALATRLDTATVTYSVINAGTTACSIDSVTAVLSFTAAGSCVTGATAAATSLYDSATVSTTFVITIPTPTPTPAPPAPPAPDPVYIAAPVVTPSPSPSPTPSPLPTPEPSPSPAPQPTPTPTPSPTPEPTPSPLPSPTDPAVVAVRPSPQTPKPVVRITARPVPGVVLPEIFTAIEIAPIRRLPGSLWDSVHISLHHMAIGQEITITLKAIS